MLEEHGFCDLGELGDTHLVNVMSVCPGTVESGGTLKVSLTSWQGHHDSDLAVGTRQLGRGVPSSGS